jgi:GntR family transcriptional regulator
VYPPGSTLPTINELAEQHGIAKGTASAAVAVLASEGLVRGVQRRGVIVLDMRPVLVPLTRYRSVLDPGGELGPWETACAEQGRNGRMVPIEVATVTAPKIASMLNIPEGAPVVRRTRHALLDGEPRPVQLHDAWYALSLVEDTPLARPAKVVGGVYGALAAAGRPPATLDEMVTARHPTTEEKAELGLRGEPVFQIDRITRDHDGRPLELLQVIANAARTVLVYDSLPLNRSSD